MTSSNDNVKELITLLQDLDVNNSFNVFIPSLQKDLKFKQLTTKQLKYLLKTLVDSPIYNAQFTTTFNSIIKENCLEEDVNIDNLTIFDKNLILFKTRIESISPEYTFNFTEEEVSQNNLEEKTITYPLAKHFDNYINNITILDTETVVYNNCNVVCSLPTLLTENKLEKELHKSVKIEINTPEELRDIVGETFINEITKFISSISINETSIDLLSKDFKTRIKIVESLPTNVINGVVKYIEKYRNSIKNLVTCTLSVKTTSQSTIEITKDFPTDATFFNI
jgi:hypothetical protein